MTGSTVLTCYRSDGWIGIIGNGRWLLTAAADDDPIVERSWALIRDGAELHQLVAIFTARTELAFALVGTAGDVTQVVVRGPVRAELATAAETVSFAGGQDGEWAGHVVTEPVLSVTVAVAAPGGPIRRPPSYAVPQVAPQPMSWAREAPPPPPLSPPPVTLAAVPRTDEPPARVAEPSGAASAAPPAAASVVPTVAAPVAPSAAAVISPVVGAPAAATPATIDPATADPMAWASAPTSIVPMLAMPVAGAPLGDRPPTEAAPTEMRQAGTEHAEAPAVEAPQVAAAQAEAPAAEAAQIETPWTETPRATAPLADAGPVEPELPDVPHIRDSTAAPQPAAQPAPRPRPGGLISDVSWADDLAAAAAPSAPPPAARPAIEDTSWTTPQPQTEVAPQPPVRPPVSDPFTGTTTPLQDLDITIWRPIAETSVMTGGSLTVAAVRCVDGHLNPLTAISCRICAKAVPLQASQIVTRPSLGILRMSTSDTIRLDHGVIFGRDPGTPDANRRDQPYFVKLADKDISRRHLEVALDGWDVVAIDLNSSNGSAVTMPGGVPEVIAPAERRPLVPGTIVHLSDTISFVYEVTP